LGFGVGLVGRAALGDDVFLQEAVQRQRGGLGDTLLEIAAARR
jgi:hypothetical protein